MVFILWLGIAACSAYVDYTGRRTVALPVFLAVSVLAVYFGFRSQRPSRFKFELMGDGSDAVRGRASDLKYGSCRIKLSIKKARRCCIFSSGRNQPSATFGLELLRSVRWNVPFDSESIPESKRKEISLSIVAALGFIQGSELAWGRNRMN